MSAVAQELYAGLQVALSAELAALSDPKIVLDAQPEASDFVLSCGSDLLSEHQRNGLNICSQDSDERPDCAGEVSCPGPMELTSKEPTEAGELAEDAESQNRSLRKQDSLRRNLRDGAKDLRDVAEEDLAQSSLISSESCSKWESLLNQEEKGFISRSSCAEITGLLPSLEENPATMQVTTESLPNPMKEEQGMKADGTRLFRESSTRVSTGVPPENSECSNVDNVMAEVVVSETSTLFSHQPVNVMDNASSEEHLQKEDKRQELAACTALSATAGARVSRGSEPGGETSFRQHKDTAATLNNHLPSMQEKKNLHANLCVPVSESLVVVADQLSDTSSGTSSLHFKTCLEFGRVLWEENMNTFDVTCETLEGCPLGKEDSLKSSASYEVIDLLEDGVPKINMKKPASPIWSSEDSSRDDGQEMSSCVDHSFSSVSKEDCRHQGSEEHLEGGMRTGLSETVGIQKEMDQRCIFPIDGCMGTEVAENKSLVEASNVCRQETLDTLQNSSSVSINSVPTYHESLGGDTKLHQEGLLKIESNQDARKGILNSASAAHLHATSAICIEGTNLDEENNETTQLSFTQQVDVTLSTTKVIGSVASEGFPGLCTKLGSESTDCLLPHRTRLLSANQKSGSCVLTSVLSTLSNAEKVTDVATPANTEEVDGLEMGHASVHIRVVDPPQEHNVNGCVSPPSESSWGHLDGTCRNLDSVRFADVSSTGLPQADSSECHVQAGNQRCHDGSCNNGRVNAEDALDVDISIYPPDTNLEQELTKTSLEVNDRMEMIESVEVSCPGRNMSEKSTGGRGLDKTIQPLKLDSFPKGQTQGELEKYQARPSPSSDLKTDLNSDHRSCIKQQGHPILDKNPALHQMRIQALASKDDQLIGLDSFNQKKLTPQETIVLTHQQHVLVTSQKQMEDTTVETLNCSLEETQKSVCCSRDELVCRPKDQDKTPQTHPWPFIRNGVHEKFQPSLRGSSSSYKKASASIHNPLNGGLIKLRNTGMLLECLGLASELKKLNTFVREWGRWRAAGFCSLLQSVRRPSELRNKKCSLKFNSKHTLFPGYNSFLPNSLMFTATNGWRTAEGVCSKLFKGSLVCISLGVRSTQSAEAGLPEQDGTSTSLSLNVVESSPAAEASLKRKTDDHICLVFSEVGESSCSVKEVVYVGSPPGSKVILVSTVHSMPGVEVTGEILPITSSGPDPSRKIQQSSDNDRSLIPEKVKIPVHYLSKEPSEALSDLLLVGKEGNTTPLRSAMHVRPLSSHLLEYISKLSLNERHTDAKDPSKSAAVKQHALYPKDAFPSITPGAFYSTVSCASLSDSMFEALAKCFRNKERDLQSTATQERHQRMPLDCLVSIDTETPVNKRTSETGASPTCMQEGMQEASAVVSQQHQAKDKQETANLSRQRSIRTGYPVARTSTEVVAWIVGKPGDPTWTLVVGSIVKDSENIHPCSTLRDLKKPERSSDLIGWEYVEAKDSEVRSPNFCFRNQSLRSTNINVPSVSVLCMLPQTVGFLHGGIQIAFGGTHRTRQSLPLRRLSGDIYKKDHMQGHFKVRRKSNKIKCSAFLKTLLETVPHHRYKLISSACLAMKPAAIENKVTMVWDQTPKQRANRSSLVDTFGISEHTKDSAVLKRLSALASNLLASSTNSQKFKLPLSSTELFPLTEKSSQLRRKKLLDVFSWVNVKLNFQWIKGSSYSTKMFNSQTLALYPVESTSVCVSKQSSQACLAFSIPTFPRPFHVKMGSSPVTLREPEVLQPEKRAFSFLLSQSSLSRSAIHDGACVPAKSCIVSASLHAAKDSRRYAVAKRSLGCSKLGLQTVLALYSPGCYRVWTRKRNLTSQIPTIQRLTVLQFSQGLKGLKCSASVSADLFSSLPYLLGRVLSIWSQHGPSTCPSEFTPLHSNHCKWQPVTTATTRLGLGNSRTFIAESSAMLPHLPDQLVEARKIVPDELRLEPYFFASLPASCPILEPEHSAVRLLAPEFESHPLDDVSVPAPPTAGTPLEKAKLEKRPKKVSQIRIRKTIPKDPNLTPMGLPRPKRLKKTEFSLEEIYTNKNYKSPPATRCLETIFEEPKEKNGSLISVSQQKRKRVLEFQDFTIPRKRKARSRVKVTGSFTRAQKAALGGRELDALLIQKLTDLETFFAMEEKQEQGHAPGS